MAKYKWYIIAAAVIAAIVAAWFIWGKKLFTRSTTAVTEDTSTPGISSERLQHVKGSLYKGVKGIEVLYWQAYLVKIKRGDLQYLDGIWGNETERVSMECTGLRVVTASTFASLVMPKAPELYIWLKSKNINIQIN